MINELTVVHNVAESTVGLRPNELGTDRGRSGHNLSRDALEGPQQS